MPNRSCHFLPESVMVHLLQSLVLTLKSAVDLGLEAPHEEAGAAWIAEFQTHAVAEDGGRIRGTHAREYAELGQRLRQAGHRVSLQCRDDVGRFVGGVRSRVVLRADTADE